MVIGKGEVEWQGYSPKEDTIWRWMVTEEGDLRGDRLQICRNIRVGQEEWIEFLGLKLTENRREKCDCVWGRKCAMNVPPSGAEVVFGYCETFSIVRINRVGIECLG